MTQTADASVAVSPLEKKGGFNQISISNDKLQVLVCPEAGRIMNIANRAAKTSYLRRLESCLPSHPAAYGIGDVFYACTWWGGIGDEGSWGKAYCYGGYEHRTGQDDQGVWIEMVKPELHDAWMDKDHPGVRVQKTVRLRPGSPTVEILDRRTNLYSSRHLMLYDLMMCLVPSGGGQMDDSLHLPAFCRVQALKADGKIDVFGREDFSGKAKTVDNVTAVLLTEPAIDEGVLVEFDRPTTIQLRDMLGGNGGTNLFLHVCSPWQLERYQVLERLFKVTPYSLDKTRVDAMFPTKVRSKDSGKLRTAAKEALKDALTTTQDRLTRAMLKGLGRLAVRYVQTGGPANEAYARECIEELGGLAGKLRAGQAVHRNFFDAAFLADRRKLLQQLPYERNTNALKEIETKLAAENRSHYYNATQFGKLAVEAMCFDDMPMLKRVAALYKKYFMKGVSFRILESGPQTIDNGNWCIPLVWMAEAFGVTGLMSEDDLAATFEILWFNVRFIDDYGNSFQGNWGTMERTFLAYLSVVLPGASRQGVWVDKAVECLDKTVIGPCSPDGGWPETPGYTHHAMLRGLELMELLARSGVIKDTAQRDVGLKRMMEYQWRLMTADDLLPPVGDGWYIFRSDIYNRFARRYQVKEWAAACLRHGWKPQGDDLLSRGAMPDVGDLVGGPAVRKTDLLPHDGYALFRNGADQFTLFYGFQMGHGHNDTLSFQFFAHGRGFVTENVAHAKTLSTGYSSRFNHEWTRASRGHSMVLVDDKSYGPITAERRGADCLAWQAREGKASGTFRVEAYPGTFVTRQVTQDGSRFEMIDSIEGGADIGKVYTWRAMLPSDVELTRDGASVIASAPEGKVRFDLSQLDSDVEVVIDSAPPKDLPNVEEILKYGKMLLLRKPIGSSAKAVFKVAIEPLK